VPGELGVEALEVEAGRRQAQGQSDDAGDGARIGRPFQPQNDAESPQTEGCGGEGGDTDRRRRETPVERFDGSGGLRHLRGA
jgi:hypothetical protein